MEQFFKFLTQIIFKFQEKFYEKKYKNQLDLVKYSASNSTSKTHLRAGVKLTLNSLTEKNKEKRDKEVKEIVNANLKNPEELINYVKNNGTKVYKLPYAKKLLNLVGEEEGFITPVKGINALVLNLVLEKKCAFKTEPMFILNDGPINIYTAIHQFHKWYGWRMQLPGFDEEAQEKFKKIWQYELDENVQTLSYEEILSLKEAIRRDIEAIDFVTKLAKEQEGARKVFKNIKEGGDNTKI